MLRFRKHLSCVIQKNQWKSLKFKTQKKKKTMPTKTKKSGKSKKEERKAQILEKLRDKKARTELVKKANEVDNVLATLKPFCKYEKNGVSVDLKFLKQSQLTEELSEWAFALLKENMQKIYEEGGWGWKDSKKRKELFDEEARFLIAFDDKAKPIGFSHFRFMEEDETIVLYIYELQIESEFRSKGLGQHMTRTLELVALRQKMEWVMLTVFKENKSSMHFFMDKMKYTIDETSPSQNIFESATYEILSKSLVRK